MTVSGSLSAIAAWPQVAPVLVQAREAATRLRFHEGLRRRVPEAAAESRVRGAHASAELDGARSTVDIVRELVRGGRAWPQDPGSAVLRGAVQATVEAERVGPRLVRAPRQGLARLHLAAGAHLLPPEQVGRPRGHGEPCEEFLDLGPAPEDVEPRLRLLFDLLTLDDAPALVLAAIAHAEVATVRPFLRGNGLVARALERALIGSRGLDPTGVAVPETGHIRAGALAYTGALAAYGTGTRDGVAMWVTHCGEAMLAAVAEGEAIADAVRAGRLRS